MCIEMETENPKTFLNVRETQARDSQNITGNGKVMSSDEWQESKKKKDLMTLGSSGFHLETLQWVGCGQKKKSGNELRPFWPPPPTP